MKDRFMKAVGDTSEEKLLISFLELSTGVDPKKDWAQSVSTICIIKLV